MTDSKAANPLWGGRFSEGPDAIMAEINASINFDIRLFAEDIAASKVHCAMLMTQNILSKEDGEKILAGLDQIGEEIAAGKMELDPALEDIHMHVEKRLSDLIGEAAGRLHTARSRNDQVATDFKLFVRHAGEAILGDIKSLQEALLNQAEAHTDTLLPGYTHLQAAQPVTFGHHLLAYVEMLIRDQTRMEDCLDRLNECPLGAAALAGTAFPIDREKTARDLGFREPTRNSLDSVSDRDFAIEFSAAASILLMHLSRLSEEIVIWASAPFHFIRLADTYSTGSSIMPQKRNPDAAELIRGKTGRVYGGLISLLTTLKGLPLSYAKDMQEDKEPLFDIVDTVHVSLAAMAGMIESLKVDKDAMRAAAGEGYSTATDLADWLVRELGLPFRRAHHITGEIVKLAENKGRSLDELSLREMQEIEPEIREDVFSVLSVEQSVASRVSFGGTAPDRVRQAITAARKRVS